jgi:nucleoid-associated protein YgaU
VYGDAAQWPRIYQANKAIIDEGYRRYVEKNPQTAFNNSEDLIFPGQKLEIPR